MDILSPLREVIDHIALDDDEPFTLEQWHHLSKAYEEQNKNLIIAKVDIISEQALTADQPSKQRSYYYSAYQLNKVIFRQYGVKGQFLFRLCALNPLTNSEMVGDVQYFVVKRNPDYSATSKASIDRTLQSTNHQMKQLRKMVSMEALMQRAVGEHIKVAEVSGPAVELSNSSILAAAPSQMTLCSDKIASIHEHECDIGDQSGCEPTQLRLKQQLSSCSMIIDVHAVSIESLGKHALGQDQSKIILKKKSHGSSLNVAASAQSRTGNRPLANTKWVAEYIGTDEEFMESEEMRLFFQKNSLDPADCELFDIPEETLIAEGIFPTEHLNTQQNQRMQHSSPEIEAHSARTSVAISNTEFQILGNSFNRSQGSVATFSPDLLQNINIQQLYDQLRSDSRMSIQQQLMHQVLHHSASIHSETMTGGFNFLDEPPVPAIPSAFRGPQLESAMTPVSFIVASPPGTTASEETLHKNRFMHSCSRARLQWLIGSLMILILLIVCLAAAPHLWPYFLAAKLLCLAALIATRGSRRSTHAQPKKYARPSTTAPSTTSSAVISSSNRF